MGRITKVTGEFMGVRFEVKPTPIRFDKVVEERRQMLLGHVHLIPRRDGDMDDPRGGVRHVIPEKGNYQKGTYVETAND